MQSFDSQDATTMISAAQIRAARALLNINQEELAKIASVHVATIRRLETATGVRGAADTLWKLQDALERKVWSSFRRRRGRGLASGLGRREIAGVRPEAKSPEPRPTISAGALRQVRAKVQPTEASPTSTLWSFGFLEQKLGGADFVCWSRRCSPSGFRLRRSEKMKST